MKKFEKVKNIHFVGIGGAGMIGIARVLLKKGYKVSGSDIDYSNDLKKLKNDGAIVYEGHHENNIKDKDLLVVSSAIDSENVELLQAKKDSITIIPRAEMLGSLMIGYESIAVAGSHGKTTTTSMVAKILSVADLSPTYVVGGKVLSTDENSDLGEGKYLVAEADESDGSFIHLQPDVAVITNIDDDHLTHFNNIFENLLDSFIAFCENVPFWGYLVINGDDKNFQKISSKISRKKITYGTSQNCDYKIVEILSIEGCQKFKIEDSFLKKSHSFQINLPGRHNVFNAAASIVVALQEGLDIEAIKKGVLDFSGVGRRYEKHVINIDKEKKFLIDDYGHHPLEIRCNLDAIREEFQDKKILMIFQPHRYTRTAQLYDEFVDVLNRVDSLILLDIYSASEEPIKGITSSALAETIKKQGHKNVLHVKNHDDLLDIIKEKKDLFDVIVTQGAGSISKVCESIIRRWKI
jgi:UDP-N-acetylmuramate--alanine ligase